MATQQYKLVEAFISADKLGDRELDIASRAFELTIFESLDAAYLSGLLVMSDDVGIFSELDITGTEYVTFKIASVEDGLTPIVEKTFIISKIVKSTKPNDTTSVLMMHLIEPHVFVNSLKPFSRAYTNPFEKIITQIVTSELDKNVDLSYLTDQTTAQGIRKVLVPYLTPLDACTWILDRATTSNGMPLFLYSSIHDNNLRLGDLDKMLSQKAFNSKIPYLYSQAATQSSSDLNQLKKATQILSYKETMQADMIGLSNLGGIGSYYTNTDAGTGLSYSTHYSVDNVIRDAKRSGTISDTAEQLIYDQKQKFKEKSVLDHNSVFFHQISSSGTYDTFKSYHDGFTGAEFELKVRHRAVRNALYKNMVEMTISGVAFMVAKATIGDIVSVNFLKAEATQLGIYDLKKSGDYLVYGTRHTFRGTTHNVAVQMSRISRDPKTREK